MADNFNLRAFLTENKLTKNTQLLNEAQFSDSYDTPAAKAVNAKANKIVGTIRGYKTALQTIQDAIKQVEQEVGSEVTRSEKSTLERHLMHMFRSEMEMEREGVENDEPVMEGDAMEEVSSGDMAYTEKVDEALAESKLTTKERRLVEMVQDAMGIQEEENVDYTMGRHDDPNQLPNPPAELHIPEGEDMVNEKPMPKYENIEKLMQEIDKSTDEAAHKHKMEEMKRVANMLEKKCTALEEGEDSDHIDQKKLKQMKKDIMTLRKGIEKMEKLGEKKFTKKETKAELKETKMETTFDLKKFLVENKLTYNSRLLSEGFLDNVAASIKGKSEQGKLAQEVLNKVGITKNPAEIFSTGIEGGGSGPFENEVQDYVQNGGDINTKIPFNQNMKTSAGGAIFKETYTFDFSKDTPTVKSGGKYKWNIKGGKWEPFGDKDGNENVEEPLDIEAMKKESDAEPGTYTTEAVMMTIADAAKAWPGGYGERLRDIIAEKQ